MNPPLRIATRQSPLAMWQAEHVAKLLQQNGVQTVIVPLLSQGDIDMTPIDGTRQVGLFTKRIQRALIDGEADIAVHSLKDLPTEVNPAFYLAAVPQRETVRDCLVIQPGMEVSAVENSAVENSAVENPAVENPAGSPIDQLPPNSRIGTGSRRRAAQLKSIRPDLQVDPIRGNVQTRLSKLDKSNLGDEAFDAIMLAEAGLLRLKMNDVNDHPIPIDQMLPAPGQGALGIEVRSDDARAIDATSKLDKLDARIAVTAERHLLASLHGGCLAPIAAYAVASDNELSMKATVLSHDGSNRIDHSAQVDLAGTPDDRIQAAIEMATRLADQFISDGATELIGRES